MHDEKIIVKQETLLSLLDYPQKPLIAVGTTAVRTLESVYWTGVKLLIDKPNKIPSINQWDPYDDKYNAGIPVNEAIREVYNFLLNKNLSEYSAYTRLLIAPGYPIKMISGMITNFHLPQSSLLLLIAALLGSTWKDVYQFALKNQYRFLSFGDACLLLNTKI